MKWLTTAQLCRLFGDIPYTYVYRWTARQMIPFVRSQEKANGSDPVFRFPQELAIELLSIWQAESGEGPLRFRFRLPEVTRTIDAYLDAHSDVPWFQVDESVQ